MRVDSKERSKYRSVWQIPDYYKYSPGENLVGKFCEIAQPQKDETLVDLGCGSGRASNLFRQNGLKVTCVDFVEAREDVAKDLPFLEANLWDDTWIKYRPSKWDYGYCCDVMEHIPTEFTMLCIDNMTRACRNLFLNISLKPDYFGTIIGEPLHLTVQSFTWWRDRLSEFGEVKEAIHMLDSGVYYVSR